MQADPERPQLGFGKGRFGARGPGLLARILAVLAGALLLAGTIAISLVVFAVVLTGALVFGIYFWWKTRDLRKQMRAPRQDDNVIEGEVISKTTREDSSRPARPEL